MKVRIDTVEHSSQLYNTAGDWRWAPNGTLNISVSRLPDDRYEFLVVLHELVEAWLCKEAGITQEAVDEFDRAWLAELRSDPLAEPGDEPASPYRDQHRWATVIEILMAHLLGVEWKRYEDAIGGLK